MRNLVLGLLWVLVGGGTALAQPGSSIITTRLDDPRAIQLTGAVPGPKIVARPVTWSQPSRWESQTSMNALGWTIVQRMPLDRTACSTSRL